MNNKTLAIDCFPKFHQKRKIITYYTVRATRVTVVSIGFRQVLLYSDTKKIKTFHLPEVVTCGTIINCPPRSEETKGSEKVLVCGTGNGSIFTIMLPTSKEAISSLKKRSNQGDVSVSDEVTNAYQYKGFHIFDISCCGGNLLVLGKAEEKQLKMILFQQNVLQSALSSKKKGDFENDKTFSYQSVPIECSGEINDSNFNFVIFNVVENQSNPYFNSLDNIQYLDLCLFQSLFGTNLNFSPVVCIFYPDGEVWFCGLGACETVRQFYRLCNLLETCSAICPVSLTANFESNMDDCCNHNMADENGPRPGLMLLGCSEAVCVLYSCSSQTKQENDYHACWVQSRSIQSFISENHGLLSFPQAFFHNIDNVAPGINISSTCTYFLSEQHAGLKRSDRVWTFQEYEDSVSLMSVNLSELFHGYLFESSQSSISNLLNDLPALCSQNQNLVQKSNHLTNMLKALSDLTTYISVQTESENPTCCYQVNYDEDRIIIKIFGEDLVPILAPFNYDIQATVHWNDGLRGSTRCIEVNGLKSVADNVYKIYLHEEDEIQYDETKMKVNLFVNLSGYRIVDESISSDVHNILSNAFPILFKLR